MRANGTTSYNRPRRQSQEQPTPAPGRASTCGSCLAEPTLKEVQTCGRYIDKVGNRKEAFEDILWSLINSTEFITSPLIRQHVPTWRSRTMFAKTIVKVAMNRPGCGASPRVPGGDRPRNGGVGYRQLHRHARALQAEELQAADGLHPPLDGRRPGPNGNLRPRPDHANGGGLKPIETDVPAS